MSTATPDSATEASQPVSWSRKQMEKALAHHQAGRLKEAEEYYRQVLRLEPQEADANNLLGVLLFQSKRAPEGLGYLSTATKVKPTEAMFFYNYAIALRAAGKADEAAGAFAKCVELNPEHADAQLALADYFLKRKRFDEAIGVLQKFVNLKPMEASGFKKLGDALHAKKNHKEAAKIYRRACDLSPKDAALQHQLGLCLQALSDTDGAIAAYRASLELKEDLAAAHNNLAIVLAEKGENDVAIEHYEKALKYNPNLFQTRCNLGGLLRKTGDISGSIQCLETAVELKSDCAEAWCNLGNAYGDEGAPEKAMKCYQTALLCKPDYSQARLNRALALLRLENFEDGWREYEWRSKLKECPRRHTSKPRWAGKIASDKKLLLHVEQGLGDTFQMVRYCKHLYRQGMQVFLEAQKPLQAILKANDVATEVFTMGEKPPAFDTQVPLMSLPSLLWDSQGFCFEEPYLAPSAEKSELWKNRVESIAGFKIGIAWQGNPDFKQDHFRSVALKEFAPLFTLPDTHFISLQKIHGLEQLDEVDFQESIQVIEDLDAEGGAFMDTAALMKELDLVVTSDSAVAHLAGALGVRTFLLLPASPDWRWFQSRNDCPWYPNTHLFRQPARYDWQTPMTAAKEALQGLMS